MPHCYPLPDMESSPTTKTLLDVYDRLLKKIGQRNWWPVRYDSGSDVGFEISAGAILVQNTSWSNAARALANLHTAGIWGYAAIHAAPEANLIRAIRSSGYYNTKTKKLKAFAKALVENYAGDDANLFSHDLPELRTHLSIFTESVKRLRTISFSAQQKSPYSS